MSGIADVLEGRERWTVAQGDCLDVLRSMPDVSVDAVVTDPPYCSGARTAAAVTNRGGMSRGEKWKSKPLDSDQMTSTGFVWMMRHVARESLRVLKPGGWFVSFIDWRQYPALYGAVETTNLRVCNMVVWDKASFALGNGFRNQHELALVATKGVGIPHNRSTGNVIQAKRLPKSEIHPTEKPANLMAQILNVVAPAGGVVLDPFAGSGTTGVAAMREGMRFVGVEREPEYAEIARARIAHAASQQGLPLEAA